MINQRQNYVHMPGILRNFSPRQYENTASLQEQIMLQAGQKTSKERDNLELQIGPPQSPRKADVSSQMFGAVQVI